MKIIFKNIGFMMLILMGIIFFYLRKQGIFGAVLLKSFVIFTIQSVALSIIGIMVITFFWNKFMAVDDDSS